MDMKFIVYFPLTPLKLYTNKKALEADGPQPLLLVPAFIFPRKKRNCSELIPLMGAQTIQVL